MLKKQKSFPHSTSSRTILSDFQILADQIHEHSQRTVSEDKQTDLAKPKTRNTTHLLLQDQIDEAFSGPLQAFFKKHAQIFAKIERLRMQLNINEDETLSENQLALEPDEAISDATMINVNTAQIDKLQSELNTKTKTSYQSWQQLISSIKATLIKKLSSLDIQLNEIEIENFNQSEPLSELKERFAALGLTLPPQKKISPLAYYFRLKIHLAINSSLNRQHEDLDDKIMQSYFKKLKHELTAIENQEAAKVKEEESNLNLFISAIYKK